MLSAWKHFLYTGLVGEEVNVVLDVVSFLCDGQRKDLQDTFGKETTHFAVSQQHNMNTVFIL